MIGEGGGGGGGTQKSNIYCLGTSRRYVTISTPLGSPPKSISVAVHGGGGWKM